MEDKNSHSASWTEIEWTVLTHTERAKSAPLDTQEVPYLARVRGVARNPTLGDNAEIVTASGRKLQGIVVQVGASYHHGFGMPLPQWLDMRECVRSLAHPSIRIGAERG